MEGRKVLTALVVHCFEALNVYGKPPEALESIIKIFQMVLGRFKIKDVELAFVSYLENNSTMPAPADIVKIIEPPVEPRKWCGATFIDIKKRWREGQFITDAEKKYCSDFTEARIKEPEIDSTVRMVEKEERKYWAIEG